MLLSSLLGLLLATSHASASDQRVLDGSLSVPPPPLPAQPAEASCPSCPDRDPTTTCPPAGTLGIRYGRCYTITDLNGTPISRGISPSAYYDFYYFGTTYSFRAPVFRICHNNTLSSCNSTQDEYVLDTGSWSLLDQSGFADNNSSEFVGAKLGANAAYYLFQTDSRIIDESSYVVDFSATIRCLFAKCAPCIKLYSKTGGDADKTQLGLLPFPFPTLGGDALELVSSSKACTPVIFQETTCFAS